MTEYNQIAEYNQKRPEVFRSLSSLNLSLEEIITFLDQPRTFRIEGVQAYMNKEGETGFAVDTSSLNSSPYDMYYFKYLRNLSEILSISLPEEREEAFWEWHIDSNLIDYFVNDASGQVDIKNTIEETVAWLYGSCLLSLSSEKDMIKGKLIVSKVNRTREIRKKTEKSK